MLVKANMQQFFFAEKIERSESAHVIPQMLLTCQSSKFCWDLLTILPGTGVITLQPTPLRLKLLTCQAGG